MPLRPRRRRSSSVVPTTPGAGRTLPPGAHPFGEGNGRALQRTAVRHRVRRALLALRLSDGQVLEARGLKAHLEEMLETRRRLDDSRRELQQELTREAPDATRLSELLVWERRFEAGARVAWSRLERRLAMLLTPRQVVRVHALPPEVLGDMLSRLTAAAPHR